MAGKGNKNTPTEALAGGGWGVDTRGGGGGLEAAGAARQIDIDVRRAQRVAFFFPSFPFFSSFFPKSPSLKKETSRYGRK